MLTCRYRARQTCGAAAFSGCGQPGEIDWWAFCFIQDQGHIRQTWCLRRSSHFPQKIWLITSTDKMKVYWLFNIFQRTYSWVVVVLETFTFFFFFANPDAHEPIWTIRTVWTYTQILESKHFPFWFCTHKYTHDPPPLHSTHQTVFFFLFTTGRLDFSTLLRGISSVQTLSLNSFTHTHTNTHKAKTNTINYSRLLF